LLVSLNVKSRSKMSLEEMLPAVEKHLRQQPSFRILRITGIIFVLAVPVSGLFGTKIFVAVLPFGLLGLILMGIPWFTKRTFRYQFGKSPHRDSEVAWSFTDEGLSAQGDGFTESLSWSKVYRLVDTTDGFLIYPQATMYYWAPFSGFGNNSEVEDVRQVARSKVMTYKRVSF